MNQEIEKPKNTGRIIQVQQRTLHLCHCGTLFCLGISKKMKKYKLLDLFCGAGGASLGYCHSGRFITTGVDLFPQKNYPFKFHQMDFRKAIHLIQEFDIIHASPPCQAYSLGSRKNSEKYPDLVKLVRDILKDSGKPYIIENVNGAPLLPGQTIFLCGKMFDLKVIRHRYFESNQFLFMPDHPHHEGNVKNRKYVTVAGHGGSGSYNFRDWCDAMELWYMTRKELTQAIPPAYTEFLAHQIQL
jgi:DNA (cytosine-5)-methyltransferase 1